MTKQHQFIENFIKLLKEQDEVATNNLETKIIQIRPLFSLVKEQVFSKTYCKRN